jgi:hypothetical protein
LDPEIYRAALLIKGAFLTIKRWVDENHRIWLITAHPPEVRQVTHDWLCHKGFGWLVDKGRVLFNEQANSISAEYKPALIDKLGIQVFIEDNPKTLRNTKAKSIIMKYLLKHPYNFDTEVDGLTEIVNNWRAIKKSVDRLAGSPSPLLRKR